MLAILANAAFAAAPLPESDLAELRGGFSLMGGLDVAISIQSDTRVDGSLLLRTVYRVDRTVPQLAIYAPASTTGLQSNGHSQSASPTDDGISVTFDRQNGPRIGSSAVPFSAISVVSGGQVGIVSAPTDMLPVVLPKNGEAVSVPNGQLSLIRNEAGHKVTLHADKLDVSHVFGNAIGSVLANTASNRVIDTTTTVSLDISGATAFNLGSSMLRIDTLVADSTAQMLPR
jgi:hypothetical protein